MTMTFDISDTLAPKSDQLDSIELADGPRVFTIKSVTRNNDDQPLNVHLVEFPRPWRPGTNMRRVLGYCWGKDASKWTGRRVELFRDPNVTFGKDKPGGTRIRALSDIDGPMDAPILLTRGKPGTYKVQPLPDATTAAPQIDVATETDVDKLRAAWKTADAHTRVAIKARVARLEGGAK